MINKNKVDAKLSQEEQELLESLERGEWKTVDNIEEVKLFAKKAAENFLIKQKKTNST